MTTAAYAAGMARLDDVLNSSPVGKSRHDQTFRLARHHVRPHVVTKAAVAEVAAVDSVGTFEALVSDFGPDRQHERFAPHAFDNAVAKIRNDGISVPVLFGHAAADAISVLGAVPPDGWRIDAQGLHATGWIDTLDPVGAKVHRMLKAGTLQWSIGFSLVGGRKRSRPGPDGITVLEEVDNLLELSVVPVPANSRTRTIGAKADQPDIPTHAELLEREAALGLDDALVRLERGRRVVAPTLDQLAAREAAIGDLPFVERLTSLRAPTLDAAVERMREQMRDDMTRILGGDTGKAVRTPRRPRDEQRHRANQVAAEFELERALTFDPRA
jgi:HK97 family phage prohead protease